MLSADDTGYLELLKKQFGSNILSHNQSPHPHGTSDIQIDEASVDENKNSGVGGLEGVGVVNAINAPIDHSEVIRMVQMCPSCFQDGESLTAITTIPHFKEIIIMAYNCSVCGYRTNEVKAGGGVKGWEEEEGGGEKPSTPTC